MHNIKTEWKLKTNIPQDSVMKEEVVNLWRTHPFCSGTRSVLKSNTLTYSTIFITENNKIVFDRNIVCFTQQ